MRAGGQQLSFTIRTHGGARKNAGRKPSGTRRRVPHCTRAHHDARHPVHVTMRAVALPRSLRTRALFAVIRTALARACDDRLRVCEFSVQSNHLHLLVESDSDSGLRSGLHGLAIRAAKAINRVFGRRGRVWEDRYHARALATPREVRHALVYILQNWRKHGRGARGIDPCSSAASFDGWKQRLAQVTGSKPLATARTWLARWGWRRRGLIDLREQPRAG
jgi:REP element-mobilizing transposase RayT